MGASSDRVDCRFKDVRCAECGKEYLCTPDEDYYEATTLEDGLCWDCFLASVEMPPQREPGYVRGTHADL